MNNKLKVYIPLLLQNYATFYVHVAEMLSLPFLFISCTANSSRFLLTSPLASLVGSYKTG